MRGVYEITHTPDWYIPVVIVAIAAYVLWEEWKRRRS